jgi:hypothetical protein
MPFKQQVERVGAVKKQLNANPPELMTGCAIEFMELHAHILTLNYYDPPDYGLMLDALKKMEERRRQPEKDGEKLEWEPGGKHYDKVKS